MTRMLVATALYLGAVAAHATSSEGPATINVIIDQKCSLFIEPGHRDFKAVFPTAQVVYKKGAADKNGPMQSCEVDVPKQAFLDQFQFCALSASQGGDGGIYYNFAGGRTVELSAVSHPGAEQVLAGFACMPH